MSEALCNTRRDPNREWGVKDVSCFPGPWRKWCGNCVNELEERDDLPDDPAEVTDTVLKRTGNGAEGGGPVLHVPASAVEEVGAHAV